MVLCLVLNYFLEPNVLSLHPSSHPTSPLPHATPPSPPSNCPVLFGFCFARSWPQVMRIRSLVQEHAAARGAYPSEASRLMFEVIQDI